MYVDLITNEEFENEEDLIDNIRSNIDFYDLMEVIKDNSLFIGEMLRELLKTDSTVIEKIMDKAVEEYFEDFVNEEEE